MRTRSLAESLQLAARGIVHGLRTQRNLRIHLAVAVLVLLFALSFELTRAELAVLLLAVGLVISMELLNTAVESVVDLATREYHPLAATAKNVAAGAVLVAAVVAAAVGYVLFFDRLGALHPQALARTVAAPASVTLISLIVVVLAVGFAKAFSREFRLQGGMPSFHAALAFALATAIYFLSQSGTVVLLAAALALMVGQSRIEGGIHSFLEVVAGALLGALATVLAFQLLL